MAFVEFLGTYVDNLQVEADLAVGKIDTTEKFEEFRNALRKFGFIFTTRSSRKENYSFEEGDDGKKKKMPGRGSLMYKSSSDVSVPFFGYPFVVETTVYYTCSQGLKYYASKRFPDEMFREGDPLAKRRRRAKTTQKIGCQARMTVKKIKVFSGEDYYVARDNWREKKAAIDNLRSDLESNSKVDSFIRYCILLSIDTTHNHPPVPKAVTKIKKNPVNPAKKVIKLHEQFQDALLHLNTELVTKCTNTNTLVQCCNSLKTIINMLKDSIERNDGVSQELMAQVTQAQEKQLKCCISAKNRADREKRRAVKEILPKIEVVEMTTDDQSGLENNENGQVIELPAGVLDGTQVIWDPINVSWVQDSQGSLVLQQEPSGGGQRQLKQSILVQRRVEDSSNISVLSQGGQNYTILQHSSLPNIGVPFTMAKVVQPGTTILSSASPGAKKASKRNDVGVTIAIPAGMDWSQQNWGQQLVVSDQFPSVPSQTVWNIAQ